jgi:predicted alpha/beta hydrolase
MHFEELRIDAADGYPLGARVYGGTGSGPLVVVNSATGVLQRYYGRFARWLSERGFTVVTYDYRGIGDSRPPRLRDFKGRMRDWGLEDFEGVLKFASREHRGRWVALVGHSVGGQLIGFPRSNGLIRAAVTVGSQLGYWRNWPMPYRLAMGATWLVVPAITRAVGYLPGQLGIGEHVPRGVALEWARWGRRPGYFLDDGVSARDFERVRAPVLSFSFADDLYAPERAVNRLHELLREAQVRRRHIDPRASGTRPIRHFGFFRPEHRDSLWTEVARFLEDARSYAPTSVGGGAAPLGKPEEIEDTGRA